MHDISDLDLFEQAVEVDGIIERGGFELRGAVVVSDASMALVVEPGVVGGLPASPAAIDFGVEEPEGRFTGRAVQPHFAADGLVRPSMKRGLQQSTERGIIGRREHVVVERGVVMG